MIRVGSLETLVVIDVETSGTNPFRHDILSLAVVPLDLAKPTLELWVRDREPEWQAVAADYFRGSRATWEQQGEPPARVCANLASYIDGVFGHEVTMVGHNIGFDVAFLRQLAFRAGLNEVPGISHRAIDTHTILYLLYASGVIPEEALSSSGAFQYFDIDVPPDARHTAMGDALATRELFLRASELFSRVSASV